MRAVFLKGFYANPIVYAFVVLVLVGFSCSPEDESVVSPKPDNYSELVQFLVNSGFEENEIEFKNDLFVIDDDILITRQEVEAYIALERTVDPGGKVEHYRHPYLVSDANVTNIKFFISSSVPSAWATAVRGAITQWNNVNGTKLFLSEVTTSSSANTIINTAYENASWVARAYLPSSRRTAGHTLTINTRYNSMDSGRKLFTMVHEMGHIFGLHHTNQTSGVFISGTPTTDANSVMNSFVLPWNGFTSGDIRAVQIIYPQ